MRVCVLGTGYVGLVSGACLAEIGHEVVCVDLDPAKIAAINEAKAPIYEEGLDALLERNAGKRLTATTDLEAAFENADLVLICVGTPFDGQHIDLQYVLKAAENIGTLLAKRDSWCVVTVKSTVVPGTTAGPVREMLERSSGKRAGVDFGLGMNPEFLAEGTAVKDFMNPDRIVVGGIDDRSTETLAALYDWFTDIPLLKTNPSTAEMIKYGSNAFLATMISFANELAKCAEKIPDVDIANVMPGVHQMSHLKPRENHGRHQPVSAASFLWPGCGFGGSCFPKDVKALIAQAKANDVDVPLLSAVMDINKGQPTKLVDIARDRVGELAGKRITVLGLAFKPGTDDMRESPALAIVPELAKQGAKITCHDPIALHTGQAMLSEGGLDLSEIIFTQDLAAALADCDAVMIVTRWPEYEAVPALLGEAGRTHVWIIDGRRMIGADDYVHYAGIGLG